MSVVERVSLAASVLSLGRIFGGRNRPGVAEVPAFRNGAAVYAQSYCKVSVAIFLLPGVVSTAVPTLGYAICSRGLPPLTTTTVRLPSPVFAAIFAGRVLGELPSTWALPGGCLILAGVVLIVIAGKSREQERRKAG